MRLVDTDGTWSVHRTVQFAEGVLAEDGITELGTAFDAIQQGPADFTFGLASRRLEPIVFGSSRAELDDLVACAQLLEITEVIFLWWIQKWFGRLIKANHRVCVKMEHAIL